MEKAIYSDGQTLQQSISKETYAKLQKVADKIGLSMEDLNVYKPWVISNNLSIYTMTMDDAFGLSAAEMANYGIDTQFLLSAMLKQKPIYELEGMKAQIDMLDGLSPEYQEESLDAMLDFILEPGDNTNEGVALLDSWFDSWKRGDVEAFIESFVAMEGEQTEFDKMLFGKRDEEMAKKIVVAVDSDMDAQYPEKWGAIIDISWQDGHTDTLQSDYPVGDPENPVTLDAHITKFNSLADYFDEQQQEEIVQCIVSLEQHDVTALTKLIYR